MAQSEYIHYTDAIQAMIEGKKVASMHLHKGTKYRYVKDGLVYTEGGRFLGSIFTYYERIFNRPEYHYEWFIVK